MKYLSSISSDNCDVTFVNGTFTGDLTVDTNTLYVDSTNNRVGIGTTSTAYRLDVTSSEWTQARFKSTGSGYAPASILLEATQASSRGQGIFYYNTSADQNWFAGVPYSTGSDDWIIGYKTGDASFNSDVAQQSYALVNLTSSGNFGIGTTSPSVKLEVNGNAKVDGVLIGTDQTYGGNYRSISFGSNQNSYNRIFATTDAGDGMYFASATGTGFSFRPNGGTTSSVVITSAGNVGIGTTSPGAKLEVSSSGAEGILISKDTVDGTNSGRLFFETDTVSEGFSFLNSNGLMTIRSQAQAGATSGNTRVAINGSGNVGIGTTSPDAKLHAKGSGNGTYILRGMSSAGTDLGGLYQSGTGDAEIYLKTSAVATNVKLSSNGTSYLNGGNVGIGTQSPSTLLHLSSANPEIRITDTSNTNYNSIRNVDGNFWIEADKGNQLGNSRIRFTVDSAEAMTIDTGGNVGIGDSSPSYKLDVDGDIQINETLISRAGADLILQARSSQVVGINSNGTRTMTLDASNNVGIGTASPGARLHVKTTTYGSEIAYLETNGRPLVVGAQSGYVYMGYGNREQFKIAASAGNGRFILGSSLSDDTVNTLQVGGTGYFSGNVGIGTTSPSAKLDVIGGGIHTNGTVHIETGSPNLILQDSTDDDDHNIKFRNNLGTDFYSIDTSGDTFNFRSLYSRSLKLFTNNTERLTVDGSGNVGIGTTSPTGSLEISRDSDDGTNAPSFRLTNASDTLADGAVVGTVEFNNEDNSGGDRHIATIKGIANASDERSVELAFSPAVVGTTTEAMRIDKDGNVGIGTTNPTTKLYVDAGESTFNRGNSDGAIARFRGKNAEQAVIGTVTSWFDSNVGIGTTTPYSNVTLQYTGNNAAGTYFGNLVLNATTANTWNRLRFDRNGVARFGVALSYQDKFVISNLYTNGTTADPDDTAFVILQNSNVGIGTSSPDQKLHVSGNTKTTNLYVAGDIIHDGDADTKIQFNTDAINFDTAGVERLRINNIGNVGIGTNNPTTRLHLKGFGSGNGEIRIDSSTGNTSFGIVRFVGDGSTYEKYLIGYNSAHGTQADELSLKNIGGDITLYTGPGGFEAERMRITSTGNVGIGTTIPSSRLTISSGTTNVVANFKSTDTAAYIAIADNTSTNDLVNQVGVTGDNMWFSTADVERIRITSAGNVGIGTASPSDYYSNKLVVNAGNENGITIVGGTSDINYLMFADGTVGNARYRGMLWYQHSNDMMGLSTSGVNRMFIDSVGNVGIGNSGPATKLDVDGSAVVRSGLSLSATTTTLNPGELWFPTGGTIGISGTGGSLNILSSGQSETLVINGNVGIGTTSPTLSPTTYTGGLHVENNTYIQARLSSSISGAGLEFIPSSGDRWEIQAQTGNSLIFYNRTDSSYRMALDGSGNVGIGTANPSQKLEVNGGGSYPDIRISATGLTSRYLELGMDSAVQHSIGAFGAGTYLTFKTVGTDRMVIDSTGNVGIGTTSPQYKLDVAGEAEFQDYIRITATAGSQKILLGNQNSSGVNNPSVIEAANGNTYIGGGDSWIAGGGTLDYTATFTDAGNVGIGTTSPDAELEISKAGSPVFMLTNTSAAQSWIQYVGSNDDFILRDSTDARTVFRVSGGGDTSFEAGNVGIGTTSPAYKLDVDSGGALVAARFYNSSYPATIVYIGDGGNSDYSDLILQSNSGTGEIFKNGTVYSGWGGTLALNIYNSNGAIAFHPNGIANAMFINTSGNVGIGTTSPTQKLHVNAGSSAGMWLQGSSDARYHVFSSSSNDWVGYELRSSNVNSFAGGMFRNNASNNRVSLYNKNSEAISLMDTGNVGIGTTNPIYKLQVAGSTYVNGGTLFLDTDQFLKWGNSNQGIKAVNDSNMSFYTGGSEKMTITSSGNVGIGTQSPTRGLTINRSNQYAALNIIKSNTTNQIVYLGTGSSGSDDDAILQMFDEATEKVRIFTAGNSWFNGGNVGIGTTSPATTLDVNGSIRVTGRSVPASGKGLELFYYSPSDLFYLEAYDYTNFLYKDIRYAALSHQFITGNVGIGTATPAQKLSVYGNIYQRTGDFITWNNGDAQIGAVSGYNLAFSTYDGSTAMVERLRITSSGNVGIGTTSPVGKLEVNTGGSAAYFTRTAGDDGVLNPVVAIATDSSRGLIAASGNSLSFRVRAVGTSNPLGGNTVMSLLPSGNVGIGTTSPTNSLTVIGPGGSAVGFSDVVASFKRNESNENSYISVDTTSVSNDSGIRFAEAGTTKWTLLSYRSSNPDGFAFYNHTAAGVSMIITDGGNVGIGTTSPAYGLTVNNPSTASTGTMYVNATLNSSGKGLVIDSTTRNTIDNSVLAFEIINRAGGNTIAATVAGNVGIGTTSPNANLQINGAGGDTTPVLRIIGSSDQAFNWGSSTQHASLTAGHTSLHLIGKANSQYNQAYFGYRHVADGSSSNMLTLGLYAADYLVNILGNGNVGIGTTSPSEKLQVYGNNANIKLTESDWKNGSGQQGGPYIDFALGGNSSEQSYPHARIRSIDRYTTGGAFHGALSFLTSSAGSLGERMRIEYNGNVGIGTTSPKTSLDVVKDSDIWHLMVGGATKKLLIGGQAASGDVVLQAGAASTPNNAVPTTTYNLTLQRDGGNVLIGNTTDSGEILQVYGDEKVTGYLHVDGDVGIGNDSPAYKLDVSGDINSDGDFYRNGEQGATGTVNLLIVGGGSVTLEIKGGIITSIV